MQFALHVTEQTKSISSGNFHALEVKNIFKLLYIMKCMEDV